jgi:1-acyl-sn-glycerol-3-phosphate acyltransferase
MELLARLEDEFAVEVDEEQFARLNTIGELESTFQFAGRAKAPAGVRTTKLVRGAEGRPAPLPGAFSQPAEAAASPSRPTSLPASLATSLPRWSRFFLVRWSRRLLLDAFLLPAMRQLIQLRVEGRGHLAAIRPPVIFAANHLSHFDTACILAALPFALRGKLSPAMSQDYFRDFLEHHNVPRRRWWTLGAQLFLGCLLFNAYPLPRGMSGARRALQYTGDLISRGFCPLVFPEGKRSPTGTMQPFMPGIGLMAMRLEAPVVPVHISGTYQIYSVHHDWPEPGEVRVRFGPPLSFEDAATPAQAAARVEEAVRLLGAGNG